MADIGAVAQQIVIKDSLKGLLNGLTDSNRRIKNAFNVYVSATKRIVDWCDSVTPTLNKFISDLGGDGPTQGEQKRLVETLNDGINITWLSKEEIRDSFSLSASDFNDVIGRITASLAQIKDDENLKNQVQLVYTDISNLKEQLLFEVQISGSLVLQMQETNVFLMITHRYPVIYDKIRQSAERLVTRCDAYRQRHQK